MAKKLKGIWEFTGRTWRKKKQDAINRLLQFKGVKKKNIRGVSFTGKKNGGWEFKATVQIGKLKRVI